MAMTIPSLGRGSDPEAAEVRMLRQLAQEAVFEVVRHSEAHYRFHGYAITAIRRQREASGWTIALTVARDGRPLVQESVVLPDA